jgi:hypothetical protein
VAVNAWLELPYYDKEYNKAHPGAPTGSGPGEHCSAFVATGSYTKDGRIVIGHNNWTSYSSGERWNVIFDIVPAKGSRILMDGSAGLIHSGDDFGLNAAGIVITETTISNFSGFDPNGIPEFVRARKAMQYAKSIDDFARIMKEGNNGGYANNWLVADRKNNEVASLELGLKNVTLQRTKDGFFVGANFPADPKLAKEETDFNLKDKSLSQNARHARWLDLMEQNKGKIDVAAGQRFLADHVDTSRRHLRRQERAERADAVRAHRRFPARHGHVAGALRPRRRRAEQDHRRRRRREDDAFRRPRPRLRAELQGPGAPGQARGVRVDERHPARYAGAGVGEVRGEVRAAALLRQTL